MNPDEDQAVSTTASAAPLLPYNAKKIEKVAKYAAIMKDEAQELYYDIDEMGLLRRMWDSKVPDKDRWFFYCFTLWPIDREEVLAEIKKYLHFYEKLKSCMSTVRGSFGESSGCGDVNPYKIILELNEKLAELHKAAQLGIDCTRSSKVYDLHKTFVARHEKLKSMIKSVECVALKEDLKTVTAGWNDSQETISDMSKKLNSAEEKYDQMCEKFNRLMEQNECLMQQQTLLLENNEKLQQQQEILLKENETIRSIFKSFANSNSLEQ